MVTMTLMCTAFKEEKTDHGMISPTEGVVRVGEKEDTLSLPKLWMEWTSDLIQPRSRATCWTQTTWLDVCSTVQCDQRLAPTGYVLLLQHAQRLETTLKWQCMSVWSSPQSGVILSVQRYLCGLTDRIRPQWSRSKPADTDALHELSPPFFFSSFGRRCGHRSPLLSAHLFSGWIL